MRTLTLAMFAALGTAALAAEKPAEAPAFEGTWTITEGVKDGDKIPADKVKSDIVVTKNEITMKTPDDTFKFTYKIDPSKTPAALDLTITAPEGFKGAQAKGILEVKAKTAKLSYHAMGGDRPKSFESKSGSGEYSYVLEKKEAK